MMSSRRCHVPASRVALNCLKWRRFIISLLMLSSYQHRYGDVKNENNKHNARSLFVADAAHVYTDSFPTNDEYDFTILDPDHIYGSPYGGFGRATASRIAALPLRLPNIGVELDEFEPMHLETRDELGRRFVCRTYHEDELDPTSLGDSMFDTVKLRQETSSTSETTTTDTPDNNPSIQEEAIPKGSSSSVADGGGNVGQTATTEADAGNDDPTSAADSNDDANIQAVELNADGSIRGDISSSIGHKLADFIFDQIAEAQVSRETITRAAEINRQLARLEGICAQLHHGWWSYEWCHQKYVSQFHVHVASDATKISDIELQGETQLGKWTERFVELEKDEDDSDNDVDDDDDDDEDDDDETIAQPETESMRKSSKPESSSKKPRPNKFNEGEPEVAIVRDMYTNGDICPDTGKPRLTQVDLRCCSTKVMNRIKGGVLYNGRPIKSDIVAIHSLSEKADAVCVYNVTICTSLLCGKPDDIPTVINSQKSGHGNLANRMKNMNVEKLSVREIIDLTFGPKTCIQSNTGGWWVYELCPGTVMRQFHETTLMDRVSGASSTAVDTEHILGKYKAEDHESYSKEDEWKHVVNATDIGGMSGSPSAYGGNGAYYYQEYTSGDICDHTDVTDSAIKAGAVGSGGIERSSTIRYSCGTRMELTVKEDHTCHYIVDVSIPNLCGHPLFKPPVSKRLVMKCLPAEDDPLTEFGELYI